MGSHLTPICLTHRYLDLPILVDDSDRGLLICAPSGSGKTTFINWVFNNCPPISDRFVEGDDIIADTIGWPSDTGDHRYNTAWNTVALNAIHGWMTLNPGHIVLFDTMPNLIPKIFTTNVLIVLPPQWLILKNINAWSLGMPMGTIRRPTFCAQRYNEYKKLEVPKLPGFPDVTDDSK